MGMFNRQLAVMGLGSVKILAEDKRFERYQHINGESVW